MNRLIDLSDYNNNNNNNNNNKVRRFGSENDLKFSVEGRGVSDSMENHRALSILGEK